MTDWRSLLTKTTANIEERFDQLKESLSLRLGLDEPLMIQAYHGYGTAEFATIKGRVLENEGIQEATDNDSIWQNMLNSYRRIESDEVGGATVQGVFHGVTATAVSDEEGYFDLTFKLPTPIASTNPWQSVALTLIDAPREVDEPVTATGKIMMVRETAVYGVISDIDDTVLQSKATSYLQAARLLFLENARTRLPFAGVSAFYQAMQKGFDDQFNPIFYVSSSPWNVFTLLTEFFTYQHLPQGPLFLKDYGITPDQLFTSGHRKHKLDQINTILNVYPDLPFILIGDSGQKDPEIYAEIAKLNPNRIKAIYIRDVTPDKRDQEVFDIAASLKPFGIDMVLAADSGVAAEHAAHHNFIDANELLAVASEMAAEQEKELLDTD